MNEITFSSYGSRSRLANLRRANSHQFGYIWLHPCNRNPKSRKSLKSNREAGNKQTWVATRHLLLRNSRRNSCMTFQVVTGSNCRTISIIRENPGVTEFLVWWLRTVLCRVAAMQNRLLLARVKAHHWSMTDTGLFDDMYFIYQKCWFQIWNLASDERRPEVQVQIPDSTLEERMCGSGA